MKKKLLILAVAILCLSCFFVISMSATGESTPTLEVTYTNLSFKDTVYIKYAVAAENVTPDDVRMYVFTEPQSNYKDTSKATVLLPQYLDEIEGEEYIIFDYTNLSAKQMTDVVYAYAAVEVDGETYYSSLKKYSILRYAFDMRTNPEATEDLNTMLSDMLTYGSSAQKYFNYNANRPANGNWYDIQVVGGTLADGFTYGLHMAGDLLLLNPAEAPEGKIFSHWENSAGEALLSPVIVQSKDETYTAIFKDYFVYSQGLEFTLNDDQQSYSVTDIGECSDTDIIIPATYEGLPVTSIGKGAFSNCWEVTSITLPDGVTSIGNDAFYYCSSLASINIPDGVTSIGNYAFNSTRLSSITIPDSVTSIGSYAFQYCRNLTSIAIPDGVTRIRTSAFADCSSLVSINIPDGVTSIDRYAFNNSSSLESITIPDSVTSISSCAFRNCTSLASVIFGENSQLTSIEEGAFYYCTSLTTVYYGGTEAKWNSLTIGSSNAPLTDATRYCFSATRPTESGNWWYYVNGVPTVWEVAEVPAYSQGLEFTLNEGGESYSVSGIGECTDTEIIIPATYEGLPVTGIGDEAFWDCFRLVSITIPDSVTSIGENAFSYSEVLASVTFGENSQLTSIGNDAFKGCTSLTSFTIPDSITSIDRYAFSGCTGLTSITIPDGITSIDDGAFWGCTSLASIKIPEAVTSIGLSAFYDCTSLVSITIPDSVTNIGEGAFSGCSSLTSMTVAAGNTVYHSAGNCIIETATGVLIAGCKNSVIPNDGSVTSIDRYAFFGCTSLSSITIPDSVTSIGYSAFARCTSLASVTFGENSKLTSIGNCAFENCTSLTSITIPNSVTSIGDSAFDGCTSLTNIAVDNNNPSYTSIDGNLYSKDKTGLIRYVVGKADTNFVIPDSVNYIYIRAFEGCTSLVSIAIPDSVKHILPYAFSGCTSLTSITIPDGVTSIDGAFWGCTSLTRITIPDSVTSIGGSAFDGCTSLASITIPDSVTSIDIWAFSGCTSLTTVYYSGTAADWDAITVGSSGNSCLTSAERYYYSETQPTEEGYWHYVDGVPTVWTELAPAYSEGLEFTLNADEQSYSVTGIGECTDTDIVIPATYNGLPVTSIGESAFSGCTSMTSIAISDGVMGIDFYAFENCGSLTSITIPESLTYIAPEAFIGCSSLKSVYVTDLAAWCAISVGHEGSPLYYGAVLYANGEKVTDIVIPDGVKHISWTFECYGILTSITIPDSVTSIGEGAFWYCSSLASVTFGENSQLTSIGNYAFKGCTSLTSIDIPDSVTSIGYDAFSGCDSLESIEIPGNVTSIGDSVFSDCRSLTSITIPDSVTSIGDFAFLWCTSLTTVYYGGTATEWDAITIGSENSCLTDATRYYYSETQPTEEGNWWHYEDGVPTAW